jgi:hypothetical protein
MKEINKFVYEIRSSSCSADEFKLDPVLSGFTSYVYCNVGSRAVFVVGRVKAYGSQRFTAKVGPSHQPTMNVLIRIGAAVSQLALRCSSVVISTSDSNSNFYYCITNF